jgi:uncharacterized protein
VHQPARTPDAPSSRTRVKRLAPRARYDRETLHAILDEALVCHVAFLRDGAPSMVPSVFVRQGDAVYLHGSTGNRAFRAVASGAEVCIEVTLLDGLVLARSAFHHSMNYRSAVIYGRGAEVVDAEEKLAALHATVEHVCPGRWTDVRAPSADELMRTLVVKVPLDEASAKVRTGGPVDDEPDHALGCWAGQLPLRLAPDAPIPDALLRPGLDLPPYLRAWRQR